MDNSRASDGGKPQTKESNCVTAPEGRGERLRLPRPDAYSVGLFQGTGRSLGHEVLIGYYACTSISTPSGRHWTPFVSPDNPSSTAASETFAFAFCVSVTT